MHSSETKQKEKQKQNEWNGQENKALEEFINTVERISKFIKAKVGAKCAIIMKKKKK